jgi:hypothetical protein
MDLRDGDTRTTSEVEPLKDLKKVERTVIDSVARHFAATWERSGDPSDVYLVFAGKRVGVEIRTLALREMAPRKAETPRLRFDRVATRLIERLRASAGAILPDGTTLLLTVTAPIRVPARTAAILEDKIEGLLGRAGGRDWKASIHGNRVQMRLLRDASSRRSRVIGFVHNPDSAPELALDMARALLEVLRAQPPRPKRHRERWLVVTNGGGSARLGAYRSIYSQLRMRTAFGKILFVFGDGSVGMLSE